MLRRVPGGCRPVVPLPHVKSECERTVWLLVYVLCVIFVYKAFLLSRWQIVAIFVFVISWLAFGQDLLLGLSFRT